MALTDVWTGQAGGGGRAARARWHVVAALTAALITALALLAGGGEPWRAFMIVLALTAVVVVLARPRLGFYALVAAYIGQWPGSLARYAGLLMLASALVWVMRRRRPLIPRSAIPGLVALHLVLVLISAVNPTTQIGIDTGVMRVLGNVALVWLCLVFIDSRHAVRTVLGVMVAAGVVTAIIGFVQSRMHFAWPASSLAVAVGSPFFQGLSVLQQVGWMGYFRIDSITGTPDFLGVTMQTVMPLALGWTLLQRTVERRLVGGAVLVALGAANLLSFTRGSLLITPVILAVTIWMVDRRRLLPIGLASLLGLLGLMAWAPFRDRALSMLQITRDPHGGLDPAAWRLQAIPVAIEMMFQRPLLGVGIDQSAYNWPLSARELVALGIPGAAPPVHNSYLLAGIEVGIGDLAVVLALVLVTAGRLRWLAGRFKGMGEAELASHTCALFAAFVGLMLAMLLYPLIENVRYFWLLVGMTAALVRLERSLRAQTSAA